MIVYEMALHFAYVHEIQNLAIHFSMYMPIVSSLLLVRLNLSMSNLSSINTDTYEKNAWLEIAVIKSGFFFIKSAWVVCLCSWVMFCQCWRGLHLSQRSRFIAGVGRGRTLIHHCH